MTWCEKNTRTQRSKVKWIFADGVGKGSLATDEHGLTQIIFAAQINTGTRMKKIQNHGGMEIQRIH